MFRGNEFHEIVILYFEDGKDIMKLSFVTIVFNGESTIKRTLESVLSQKTNEVEYIIVDGKSTDHTMDIVQEYKDDIDLIISEKDDGIADAFNKGIRLSNGDYIGLINCGDILLDGVVDKLMNDEKNFGIFDRMYDVIYGDCKVYDIENNNRVIYRKALPLESIQYTLPFSHQSCLIAKSAYLKNGLYSKKYKICMDYALVRGLYAKGASFYYTKYPIAMFSNDGVSYYKPVETILEDLSIAVEFGLKRTNAVIYGGKYLTRYYARKILLNIGVLKNITQLKDRYSKRDI